MNVTCNKAVAHVAFTTQYQLYELSGYITDLS